MKHSVIRHILGQVLKFEGIFLLLPFFTGLAYREQEAYSYLIISVVCFLLGFLLTHEKVRNPQIYSREGFAAVALSWIILSILGAIPFVLSGDIPSYADALFETVSGFTTTGASILSDVEALSHAGLMWRSFTHWVGGMGVLVFILSFLPLIGGGSSMNLMKAETPGPSVSKLVPHVRDTAKILYEIYFVMTLLVLALLCLFGMPLFDALTTTFSTVGTGGFGVKNSSIADYSPALQNILTAAMFFSGINYVAYFYVMRRQWKEILKVEEIRAYFLIVLTSTAVIAWNIRDLYDSAGDVLRHAAFQTVSLITTTGFATTDYDLWPQTAKMVLLLLMFTGACSGSTSCGFKISRLILLFKSIPKQLSLMIHPREVRVIKMDGRTVDHTVLRMTNVYLVIYFFLLFASMLLLSADNLDFTTTFTAALASLNNIGPGFSGIGPAHCFSDFSVFSKFVLMFDMLAGRLGLYPLLILFLPSVWKRK